MITRKIIKKILPNALPLAIIFISATSSWKALADGNENLTASPTDKVVEDKVVEDKVVGSKVSDTKIKGKKAKVKSALPSTDDSSLVSTSKDKDTDSRVKELMYNESNVYVIRTKFGYQTNVVFDPKEEVQTISVGDRSLWQIIPAGNRLFIRPMTENISTNMTLLTNKHSYEFDLKSVDEKNESNVYVVRFNYPEKHDNRMSAPAINDSFIPSQTNTAAEYIPVQSTPNNQQQVLKMPSSSPSVEKPKQVVSEAASPESIGLLPIRFNYSYTYAGPDAIAPMQVYDDGKTTFIKYKSIGKTAPNAFIINSNGKESSTPAIVQGTSLIIDGVAGELALRSTDGEIRIYNESLNQR